MGFPYYYWPNALMMNKGDGTFEDRADTTGIDPPPGGPNMDLKFHGRGASRSSRSAAVADFRNDGRLDIIVNNFNDAPYYYRNYFPMKNWIEFRLTGAMRPGDSSGTDHRSNRDAIGALVKLHIGNEVMLRQVQGAGGYLSQSSLALHFGLGDRTRVDYVGIIWPGGRHEVIQSPAINTLQKCDEPRN
jgi:hypothetical protein